MTYKLHAFGDTIPMQYRENSTRVELYGHELLPARRLVPLARGLAKLQRKQDWKSSTSLAASGRLREANKLAEELRRGRRAVEMDGAEAELAGAAAAAAAQKKKRAKPNKNSHSMRGEAMEAESPGGRAMGKRKAAPRKFHKRRCILPWEVEAASNDPTIQADNQVLAALLNGHTTKHASENVGRKCNDNDGGSGGGAGGSSSSSSSSSNSGGNGDDAYEKPDALDTGENGNLADGHTDKVSMHRRRSAYSPDDALHILLQAKSNQAASSESDALRVLLSTTHALRKNSRSTAQRRAEAARMRFEKTRPFK